MSALRSLARWIGNKSESSAGRFFAPAYCCRAFAERLVLHASLGREPGNVGRQECEWVLRVALVLREVERHAADEPPLRISLAEVGLDPTRMMLDLGADERVELRPPGREDIGGEVFTTVHGRRLENLKRQVRLGWLRDGRDCTTFPIRRRMTEPGQVQTGEVTREAERRRQARLELSRCQVQ